jgi:hypothetical protein
MFNCNILLRAFFYQQKSKVNKKSLSDKRKKGNKEIDLRGKRLIEFWVFKLWVQSIFVVPGGK